jgi:hypothetical protein
VVSYLWESMLTSVRTISKQCYKEESPPSKHAHNLFVYCHLLIYIHIYKEFYYNVSGYLEESKLFFNHNVNVYYVINKLIIFVPAPH